MPKLRSEISGVIYRLTASERQLYAEAVRDETSGMADRRRELPQRGEMITIAGRLATVVVDPAGSVPTLEADLFNGDITVTLIWLGRRRIAGLEPGRTLVAAGRVATDQVGRMVMYNPRYSLVSDRDDTKD